MAKLLYKMGDIFALPLRNGRGFCLGVIAGMPKSGKVLLGYFYDKIYTKAPSKDEVPDLKPEDAIRIWQFGDLSLYNHEWPIVGHINDFKPQEWPSPKFFRESMLQLVTYSNDDPRKEIKVERYIPSSKNYESDSLWGAGAVEIMMTKIIGQTIN